MRTSREIIQDIYHREGQEAAAAFLHRLLRHTTRCCAIPDARRFLAGIEIKPFAPRTVDEVAAEHEAEAPQTPAPLPPNRPQRILAYMESAGRPLTNLEIHTALDLKKSDCSSTLLWLCDLGKVRVAGETRAPCGRKAKLYALPQKEVIE